ncbi:unnamed protein product [Heligmosomoides polygyrus]|uniref:Uncharacterized protein n=1 Tax=Heligmosomoides polygyrus TaxID=6339 RepID=A0A3P8BDI9_HELPZ|nr:unnamed protein product [Heligmosomoides polygyrus]
MEILQKAKPVVLPSKPKGSGLLSMLPTPKFGLGGATNKGVADNIHLNFLPLYSLCSHCLHILLLQDLDARKLIMKHEMGPMGTMDLRTLNSAAADIVDIRVDDALGPDVKATLLKNLHVAARAKDAMAPLPKSKNPADVTSKRKHQITYLANLAVAREEALQQQWAESKQMRRMGRQKYGF